MPNDKKPVIMCPLKKLKKVCFHDFVIVHNVKEPLNRLCPLWDETMSRCGLTTLLQEIPAILTWLSAVPTRKELQ